MNGPAGFRIYNSMTKFVNATTSGLFVLSAEIAKGCQGCTGGGGGAGTQGTQGSQGRGGLQGPAGSGGGGGSGTQGYQGYQGRQGSNGSAGAPGSPGVQGTQGNFSGVMTSDITMGSPNLSFGNSSTALGSLYVNNVGSTDPSPDGNPNKAVYFTSNLLPAETNKYNIGSVSLRWNTGFFGANTLYVGDVLISQTGNTASGTLLTVQSGGQSTQLVNTSPSNNKIPGTLLPFSSFVYGFAITYADNEAPSQRTNWGNQIYSIINELNPNYNGLDNPPSIPTGSTALNFDLYSSALSGTYYIIQFSGGSSPNPTVTLNIPTLTFPTADQGVTFTFSNIGFGVTNNITFKQGDIVLFGMAVNSAGTGVTCTMTRILFEVPTGSIGSDKIADLAVTHPKIAYDAVQTANILDGNVTFNKLNEDVITYIDNSASVSSQVDPVAIGLGAGQTGQSSRAVAIGFQAGNYEQGPYAIAIGYQAGATGQVGNSIVINASGSELDGNTAGFFVSPIRYALGDSTMPIHGLQGLQGPGGTGGGGNASLQIDPVSIGINAGLTGQGAQGIAIGYQAGNYQQGDYAIALGYQAGLTGQSSHSIILNASGQPLDAGTTGMFVKPLRFFSGQPVQLGVQGLRGLQGFQGIKGFQGAQGFQGVQGFLGPQGGVVGLSTQLQYNMGGNFAASSNLVYDPSVNVFSFGKGQTGGNFQVVGTLTQGITGTTGQAGNAILAYNNIGRFVEIGADSPNTAYIDFHSNDNVQNDSDARLLSIGGSTGNYGGLLSLEASLFRMICAARIGSAIAPAFKMDYGKVAWGSNLNNPSQVVSFTDATMFTQVPMIQLTSYSQTAGTNGAFVLNDATLTTTQFTIRYFGTTNTTPAFAASQTGWMAMGI